MYPIQVNAQAAAQLSTAQLRGHGFAMRPTGGNADFPRQIQLDGKLDSAPWDNTGWRRTPARELVILAGAVDALNNAETTELWTVMVAESEADFACRPWQSFTFTGAVANQVALSASAPTNGLKSTQGWGFTPGITRARMVASSAGIVQWVYSRISGLWTANSAPLRQIEDDLVLVPDGRTYLQGGQTVDLYFTKSY